MFAFILLARENGKQDLINLHNYDPVFTINVHVGFSDSEYYVKADLC